MLPPSPAASPPAVDAEFGRLLRAIVTDEGLLRYDLILADQDLSRTLQAVIAGYGAWDSPPEDKYHLAFWLNTYNANVIALVCEALKQRTIASVQDIPDFFDAKPVAVGGKAMTLRQLEGEIHLLHDVRAFAAMVCGARGAPPMGIEPYDPQRLDQQLADQCRRWLDDQARNRASRDGLELSEIFRQHADDFALPPYGSINAFIRKFARPNGVIRELVKKYPDARCTFIPYDWRLNCAAAPSAASPAAPVHDDE